MLCAEDGREPEGWERPAEDRWSVSMSISRTLQLCLPVLRSHGTGKLITSTVGGYANAKKLQQGDERREQLWYSSLKIHSCNDFTNIINMMTQHLKHRTLGLLLLLLTSWTTLCHTCYRISVFPPYFLMVSVFVLFFCCCCFLCRCALCRFSKSFLSERRSPCQGGGLCRRFTRLQRRKSAVFRLITPNYCRPISNITMNLYHPFCCCVYQQEVKQQDFFVGTVRVNGRMDWTMLDSAVSQAFKVRCLRLTARFSAACPRTECAVGIKHVDICDWAVTLNLAHCYFWGSGLLHCGERWDTGITDSFITVGKHNKRGI